MTPFASYPLAHGLVADFSQSEFPTLLWAWTGNRSAALARRASAESEGLRIEEPGTHFGFVYEGSAVLRCSAGTFTLTAGIYFAVPGELTIEQGSGMIVSRLGYRGFFHLGGPVEAQGRLRYINGCTDSLLIPPVTRGDPCLNLLHFPPGTQQSEHTHPSLRAGIVFRGAGHCAAGGERTELSPGRLFVIRPTARHSFYTTTSPLVVLAYHPDSDFGPTHENHPMINRTIIAEN